MLLVFVFIVGQSPFGKFTTGSGFYKKCPFPITLSLNIQLLIKYNVLIIPTWHMLQGISDIEFLYFN